ncbi:hypothetical protein OAF83_01460 [Rubripirellula sp.]|nr:hypothetical protein [Rubripirellula sp.]
MGTEHRSNEIKRHQGVFCTTQWTLVMQASEESVEARDALGVLCEAYWNPVFEFVRREGRSVEESQELTQEFFKRILEGGLGNVTPGKGRFRSYLLGAVKHFLADAKRDQARIKRGGDVEIHSIDSSGSGTSAGLQIADPSQPDADALFDRAWALALIERGLLQVEMSYEKSGKTEQFDVLKPWLIGDSTDLSVAAAAAQLALSSNAVTVAIHRLRKSFRGVIQEQLLVTVTNADDLDEELTYLIKVLAERAGEASTAIQGVGTT